MTQGDIKYLVKIEGDKAFLNIVGKASYLNCRNVSEFFSTVATKGCKHLYINFGECVGMDSTFMGMIAGVALRLRKKRADVTLLNLKDRNLQLIENLGIYKLVKIEDNNNLNIVEQELETSSVSGESMLKAHENLIEADSSNLEKFEDVITFLKKETEQTNS